MDNDAIRARIGAQGWKLLELPIRKTEPGTSKQVIARWKVMAVRGDRSIEVGGDSIDEALRNIGQALGVIAREANVGRT